MKNYKNSIILFLIALIIHMLNYLYMAYSCSNLNTINSIISSACFGLLYLPALLSIFFKAIGILIKKKITIILWKTFKIIIYISIIWAILFIEIAIYLMPALC